jgi:hypothetical protein
MKRGTFVQPIYLDLGKYRSEKSFGPEYKLQYLEPLIPSKLFYIHIDFEPILTRIKHLAQESSVSPCELCFISRQMLFSRMSDLVNDDKMFPEEISKSLRLGENTIVNEKKQTQIRKRGFFKGVILGLNETVENYCGTSLLSLGSMLNTPHLLICPCVAYGKEEFNHYRKIFIEIDSIVGAKARFDAIYNVNEKICKILDDNIEFQDGLNMILEALDEGQRKNYLENYSVKTIYDTSDLPEMINSALHSAKIEKLGQKE